MTIIIMTLTEYEKLKNLVVVSFGINDRHNQILSILKETYRDVINSPRRYEEINTIGQLLRVLEIRDILSESNIRPLRDVASKLPNNSSLLQSLDCYEHSRSPAEIVKYFAQESTQSIPERKQFDSFSCNNPVEKRKQLIIETVVEDIGSYWRDLARNLNIKEKYIDEINDSYNEISLKAKHMMNLFIEKADCQRWFNDLCEALESSRRKDLSRKLKEISVMNISPQ